MKKIIILMLALLSGAMASQFPEYAQQYRQHLAGAVEELRGVVDNFDADATAHGLTRAEALARYDRVNDEFLSQRGQTMGEVIARYERLSAHFDAMNNASEFQRVWIFAKARDPQIAQNTLEIYQPAVPVSTMGFVFAGVGFLLAWVLLSIVLAPFGRSGRRRRMA